MGRMMPVECPHGVIDWGDFGPCGGYCESNGHDEDHCPDSPGCKECGIPGPQEEAS